MNNKEILQSLLEFEMLSFSQRLGLKDKNETTLEHHLVLKSLSSLSSLTNSDDSEYQKQYIITVCSIIWTHCKSINKDELRQILSPIMSGIGFSPSINMLDSTLKKDGVYSEFNSYLDKITIALNDLKNQITLNDITYTLTSFQREIWESIKKQKITGVSAPTSAGKSFIIYLKIIDLINNGAKKIVYVVPTLSLISQVTSDLSNLQKKHKLDPLPILNSYDENIEECIYVLTQERTITILSDQKIKELDLLVVDEIQNIERVEDEKNERARILYDALMDLRLDVNIKKIILSGPRLNNIGSLGFELFGELSDERMTDAPPVLNITYSISKENKNYYFNQYSSLLANPIRIKIDNDEIIGGFGKVRYNDEFNSYLNGILEQLSDDVNIIFSPTAKQARVSAHDHSITREDADDEYLVELSEYFKNSVHRDYQLANIVRTAAAYHTSRIPMHVRRSIEIAISEQKIKNIFCTTTLMQGVNLPAKNIVIRNPNLFIKKSYGAATLSPYEFSNLRGRAGRLLTDFIGRTIVLDENSFEASNNTDDSLFSNEYKDISTGYGGVYERNSTFIDATLSNSTVLSENTSKSLVTYIRQMLYRHGVEAIKRLQNVGIHLDAEVINNTIAGLNELKVPRAVILQNRYWDPFDLNELYHEFQSRELRITGGIFQLNLCELFLSLIELMHGNFDYYFKKYLGNINDSRYFYGIAKSAESWARETPLKMILENRFQNNDTDLPESLDKEIEKLTKHVSYGLPMLIKPLVDMSENISLISQIESGMFHPITKHLSERGVPRETAIKIRLLNQNATPEELNWPVIMNKLNYWERIHIQHLT